MKEASRPRRVGVVIYPDAQTLDVTGPHEVFSLACTLARRESDRVPYEVFLVAATREPVRMTSGLQMQPDHTFEDCPFPLDTLVVAGSDRIEQTRHDPVLLDWLATHVTRARRVVSICTGAFFLAEIGLFDGRQATTHWAYCDRLASLYPRIEVVSDAIYVKQGNVYSSAGITAGMDLALTLVEEDLGKDLAMALAKTLVLFYRRPGGQDQFSEVILSQSSTHFGELVDWILQNLRRDLTVDVLAAQVHMSPRNFARLFREELDETPARFVQKLRLRHAVALLENSALSLKQIAGRCGFSSDEQMRRAFRRALGVTPQEYRERFH